MSEQPNGIQDGILVISHEYADGGIEDAVAALFKPSVDSVDFGDFTRGLARRLSYDPCIFIPEGEPGERDLQSVRSKSRSSTYYVRGGRVYREPHPQPPEAAQEIAGQS